MWIRSYLSLRIQSVVVDGATSSPKPVLSSVPQGPVLGPLLFLVYINDITTISLSALSQCVLYADDVLLYRPIASSYDARAIQFDMEEVEQWADNNHLNLNATKCKYMVISRKQCTTYSLPFISMESR